MNIGINNCHIHVYMKYATNTYTVFFKLKKKNWKGNWSTYSSNFLWKRDELFDGINYTKK